MRAAAIGASHRPKTKVSTVNMAPMPRMKGQMLEPGNDVDGAGALGHVGVGVVVGLRLHLRTTTTGSSEPGSRPSSVDPMSIRKPASS